MALLGTGGAHWSFAPVAGMSIGSSAGRVSFGPAAAQAQGVAERRLLTNGQPRELGLAEAVAIGQEDNPEVRAARYRYQATRAGLWEAWGNFLPRLELFSFVNKSSGGQVVVDGVPVGGAFESYTTSYEFQLTHRLFDAGRDIFRVGGAKAARRAALGQVGEERLQAAGEIERQYVAALAAEALRAQAERELERAGRREELARARFELGAVTRSDVLRAEIGISQAEVDRVENAQGVRAAKLELLRAMGVVAEPDSLVLVERLEVFAPTFAVEQLLETALRAHPQLERLRGEVARAASERRIATTAYLPALTAAMSFENTVSDTAKFRFEEFEERRSYFLGLSWELFGGFSRYNLGAQAAAELRAAEEGLRAGELLVATAVRRAYLELVTAHATQAERGENVELARRDLELAQERYRIGALSFPDFQDAQVTFSQAETDWIRSTYDFFVALANLEEASAQPLFPTGPRAPTDDRAPADDAEPDDDPTPDGDTTPAAETVP